MKANRWFYARPHPLYKGHWKCDLDWYINWLMLTVRTPRIDVYLALPFFHKKEVTQ